MRGIHQGGIINPKKVDQYYVYIYIYISILCIYIYISMYMYIYICISTISTPICFFFKKLLFCFLFGGEIVGVCRFLE